jgi:hypothetical protein
MNSVKNCYGTHFGSNVHVDVIKRSDSPTLMLGNNISLVLNTSVSSSVLKKKHNAIAYYRVLETIAAKMMRFAYVRVKEMSVTPRRKK